MIILFSVSKISKRIASEDCEEGEASDGVDPSPSREFKLQVAGKAPARSRDPIKKVKYNARAERTVKARAKGAEEGIAIGKRESAKKIEDQNTQIKERSERDQTIIKEEKQIKRLTDQLAPRQRIYCLQVNAVISVQHR